MNATTTPNLYRVPAENLADLQTAIARLARRARRAEKLGCSPVVLTETGTEDVALLDRMGYDGQQIECYGAVPEGATVIGYRRYHLLTVTGEAPRLAGWEFVGTVAHGENGNVLRLLPGAPAAPHEYRTRGPVCDHCRTARRRNDTYLVRHEDGRWAQVGRQCVRDFLGHQDPEAVLASAEYLMGVAELCEMAQEDRMGGRFERRLSVLTVLYRTVAVIRAKGWVSRTAASESYAPRQATADLVTRILTTKPTDLAAAFSPEELEAMRPTDADVVTAEAALEWARAIDPQTDSDYLHNLRVVCSGESAGLSVAELARRAGLNRPDLHRYERGQVLPGWAIVCRLADALGVSLDAFRGPAPSAYQSRR